MPVENMCMYVFVGGRGGHCTINVIIFCKNFYFPSRKLCKIYSTAVGR